RNADDVARPRVLHALAPLREEGHDVVRAERLAGAAVDDAHAAPEAPRADAHERDAVTVPRIHVRLDLEDDTGEARLHGVHRARERAAGARRRGELDERVEHLLYAEIVDGRAEEERRLPAREEGVAVEGGRDAGDQRHRLACAGELLPEARLARRIVETLDHLVVADAVLAGAEDAHAVAPQVEDPAEGLAHADRPGARHDRHPED